MIANIYLRRNFFSPPKAFPSKSKSCPFCKKIWCFHIFPFPFCFYAFCPPSNCQRILLFARNKSRKNESWNTQWKARVANFTILNSVYLFKIFFWCAQFATFIFVHVYVIASIPYIHLVYNAGVRIPLPLDHEPSTLTTWPWLI